MAGSPSPAHLSGHHRDTVQKILQHPLSRNIEWRDVVSLLQAIGTVDVHRDNKVEVHVGSQTAFFDVPTHKMSGSPPVVDLRRMLTAAGYRGVATEIARVDQPLSPSLR
jgi:hypothetical protein